MTLNHVLEFYDHLKGLARRDSALFDLHGFTQDNTKILFKKKDVDVSSSEDKHINIRVLKDGRAGVSYTKDFSKKALEDCYQRAKETLNWTDQKAAGDLSLNQKNESLEDFYHPDFNKFSGEKKLEKARQIHQSCLSVNSKIQPSYCYLSDQDRISFFVNSNQSCDLFHSSFVLGGSYCLAVDEKRRSLGFASDQSRDHYSIDSAKIGRKSAELALKKLAYEVPKTKKYSVIFKAGQASGSLLGFLVDLMSAKRIFEGLSLLNNSLNKKLFSKDLFIYDDPFALWGPSAQAFDAEGFPSEKSSLIENGVLKNYLSSSFYAKKMGIPHTKKAVWVNNTLWNQASNLIMEEGESSFEEILSSQSELIVIDKLAGLHSGYNPISGDFSFNSEGFLWKAGEMRPICRFTVSGNILKIFSDISKIANDSQIEYSTKSPSFLVPDLMIAGK